MNRRGAQDYYIDIIFNWTDKIYISGFLQTSTISVCLKLNSQNERKYLKGKIISKGEKILFVR